MLAQFNTGIFQRFNSTSFNRWLVCFLIGVFTACIAVIVDVGIEQLSNIKLDLVRKCKFNSTSLPLITVKWRLLWCITVVYCYSTSLPLITVDCRLLWCIVILHHYPWLLWCIVFGLYSSVPWAGCFNFVNFRICQFVTVSNTCKLSFKRYSKIMYTWYIYTWYMYNW